jgi:beta-glucuronidase
MIVPGCFDAMPLYSGVRGTAVYRQQVTLTPNTEARIKFEACGFYCAVFVDGQKIGYHGNGYSPFWMDIPSSDSVDREVIVLVDNRFNSALAPLHMESYDFYQYGGIARSVYVHEVGAMSVENVDGPTKSGLLYNELMISFNSYDS